MIKKCKECGKWFNVGAFSEEYCPYFGTVLEKEDRQKIRNREYFAPAIIAIVIIVLFIIFWILSWSIK